MTPADPLPHGLNAEGAPHSQWRVLDTGSGNLNHFLRLWQNWRNRHDCAERPQRLHVVVTASQPLTLPMERPTALDAASFDALTAQLWGLVPGFHQVLLDGGRVSLTLCLGDELASLKQLAFKADLVLVKLPSAPDAGNLRLHTVKAIARCARRGTRLVVDATGAPADMKKLLTTCGFVLPAEPRAGEAGCAMEAIYAPAWQLDKRRTAQSPRPALPGPLRPTTCTVVGAGLAGAAVAASLARRGWQVTVLDTAPAPASGASSLPAGFLVAHSSPDDSLLSRLSRSGVRLTLHQAETLLTAGLDWAPSGVLTHLVEGARSPALPAWAQQWPAGANDWRLAASAEQLQAAGLADVQPLPQGIWQARGAWIKPSALVQAWLQTPGVVFQGGAPVARLTAGRNGWCATDALGQVLAQSDRVVLAAGTASRALAAEWPACAALALQAVRGQVSLGPAPPPIHTRGTSGAAGALPPFPVNGQGGLLPQVPGPGGMQWVMGATYHRDVDTADQRFGDFSLPLSPRLPVTQADHQDNFNRLHSLLPHSAAALAPAFASASSLAVAHANTPQPDQSVKGWTGIRCTTPTRLPMLGELRVSEHGHAAWLCAGMGSRGLSFAALCAELLAAQWHGEPWPIERQLAQALLPATENPATEKA